MRPNNRIPTPVQPSFTRSRAWSPLSAAAALAIIAMPRAEAATIQNAFLKITVEGQHLSVHSKQAHLTFIPDAAFTRRIERVEVEPYHHVRWGTARQLHLTHPDGWSTQIRLFEDQPFVQVHTRAGNTTDEPTQLKNTQLLTCNLDLGISARDIRTLGTDGLHGIDAPGSYAFLAVADPQTRRGIVSGWLTHERGIGVFLPGQSDDSVAAAQVTAQLDFGQFQVRPGASRPTDTMLIGWFEDARLGLEAYADAIARHYAIQLKPQPGVYCTWYHAGASDEEKLAANTEFAARHLAPFGLSVMQIDDKWQAILPKGFKHEGKIKATGPIKVFTDANDRFPHGMAHTARMIADHRMVPGIWFMPFAGNFRNPYFDPRIFATHPDGTPFHDERWSGTCLDLSNPLAQQFLVERVRRIHGWGYRYFKLDGMHTGAPSYNIYVHTKYREDTFPDSRLHDPDMTHSEAYRKGLQIVRDNAPDTFILGCNVSQNMCSMGPSFGLIDAMRIGPDNGAAGRGQWNQVKVGAWHGSTLYFLNNRVWHNDPDPVYVRPSNPLNKARLMCSWVAVSGSMLTTSYQFADLPPERLDLLKRTLPGHDAFSRPVDSFEQEQPRIWLLTDKRTGVQRNVIGLFNWNEKEPATITCDLGKLGLDAKKTYVAFDYWADEFVEPFQGELQQTLPGASCRVLAVRPVTDHPQLLSTSRHITQGIVDVLAEHWDAKTRTLSGTSRVVGSDPYELRIALPTSGSWQAKKVSATNASIELDEAIDGGLRVRIESDRSQDVRWRVEF